MKIIRIDWCVTKKSIIKICPIEYFLLIELNEWFDSMKKGKTYFNRRMVRKGGMSMLVLRGSEKLKCE